MNYPHSMPALNCALRYLLVCVLRAYHFFRLLLTPLQTLLPYTRTRIDDYIFSTDSVNTSLNITLPQMAQMFCTYFSIKQLKVTSDDISEKALRRVKDTTFEVITEKMSSFGFDQTKRGTYIMVIKSSHLAHFSGVLPISMNWMVWNLNAGEVEEFP